MSEKSREFHVFEGMENITQFIKTKSVIFDHRHNQIVRKLCPRIQYFEIFS